MRDGERKSREHMKMCWETQLRLALLSTGFMSPRSVPHVTMSRGIIIED